MAAKKYSKDHLSGSLVAIVGIAQVIAGALIAISSGGFAAEFGISLAAGGIGDIIKGARSALKGESIELNQWFKGKSIEIAVSVALSAVSTAASSSNKAVTQGVKKGAEQGVKGGVKAAIEFGKQVGRRVLVSKLTEMAVNKAEDVSAHAIKAEIKALQAAIKESLQSPEIHAEIEQICATDAVQRQRTYMSKFERSVLAVMDQRSSQFASIAQQALTTAMTSASSGTVSTLIGVGSVGVSVARGVGDIRDLKSYLLAEIESSAHSTATQLPGFDGLLQWRHRQITSFEAKELQTALERSGTLSQGMQVNTKKLGFTSGMESVISSGSNFSSTPKVVKPGDNIQVQPFTFSELSRQSNPFSDNNNDEVLIAPVNSSSGNSYSMELSGSGGKYRTQVSELLQDIDRANKANYDAEIEQTAEHISSVAGDRLRGLIRSGVITPVTSAIVNYAANELMDWVEKEYFNQTHDQQTITGISSGDVKEDKLEEDYEPMYNTDEADSPFDPEGGEKIGVVVNQDPWEAFTPKTLDDIGKNLHDDFLDLKKIGTKYYANVPAMALASVGEVSELVGDNIVYGVSKVPGGKYALECIGSVVGKGLDMAFLTTKKGAKFVLSKEQMQVIAKEYQELPHGIKVLGQDAATAGLFLGVGKLAKPVIKTVGATVKETIIASEFWTGNKIPVIPVEVFKDLPKDSIFKTPEDLVKLKPLYKKGADYFDKGADVIAEAARQKLKVDALPSDIAKDFAAIIKVDEKGIVKGIHHMEDHHILLKSEEKFKALFGKADMSINDSVNMVLLPDRVGASFYPTKKATHSGMHAASYSEPILKETNNLLETGILGSWDVVTYSKKIDELLNPIRDQLNRSELKLNNAKPIVEKVLELQKDKK